MLDASDSSTIESASLPPVAHSDALVQFSHLSLPARRRAVIVDTDLSSFSGDLWALAYLLAVPVDLKYVMASGGDTRLKMRILAKFMDHCGREEVEIGAGPPGEESPWLKADDAGVLRPCAAFEAGCVPHPILKEWARHYDDSRHLRSGDQRSAFYDPVVRVRDVLDECCRDGQPVTILATGSLENLQRLVDLDAECLSRDGRDVRVVVRGGTVRGGGDPIFGARPDVARRVLGSCRHATVLPSDVCRRVGTG